MSESYFERNDDWALSKTKYLPLRNQEYYEKEDVVDAYDFIGFLNGEHSVKPSSFFRPTSFQFLEIAEFFGAKRFLDIGCGAGFFRYLLENHYDQRIEEYQGFDISSAQVDRAVKRFGEYFAVKDAGEIAQEELNRFDAVHVYSVLNFMRPERQLTLVDQLLNANAVTFLDFSVTDQKIEFCPTHSFNHLGKMEIDGEIVLSQIGFCTIDQIVDIVNKSGKYQMATAEIDFSVACLVNDTAHDGSVQVSKESLFANKVLSRKKFGRTTKLKALNCVIWPKEMDLPTVAVPDDLIIHL